MFILFITSSAFCWYLSFACQVPAAPVRAVTDRHTDTQTHRHTRWVLEPPPSGGEVNNWTRRDCWWDADSTPSDSDSTRRTCNLRSNTARSLRAQARESPEERETRRRANTNAMREARARRIADCGWQTLPVHRMPHPHPIRFPLCVPEVLLFTPQHTHKSSWSERSYL